MEQLSRNGPRSSNKRLKRLPSVPTLTPDPFIVGSTRISGSFYGSIVKATAYLNNIKKATGGEFTNGRFTYYVGGGVTKDSLLEIEGLDINNNIIVEKQIIEIRGV
ncbi:immunoglobulin-like domain-containing protein [Carnobacterium maltaromaticum]|uniref:immunoglobulin-like domain-containing protein n=1 Tax=Carnobacterium maltaromaticum TaxID=2751 RepID=UPI00298A3C42|nr:immunoglobulin-like domain-containing protein [Carnobacterium maltaromaticum]MDW5522150.1 immunoglobulin-like domain-containing protein [Carnobacterium maltaromaticum]